jgi:membrane-bound lytic murein transglycosylase D
LRLRLILLFAMLGVLSACGGHHESRPVAPVRSSGAASSTATASGLASNPFALPPAPELDTLLPMEELTAEVRLASDSAADEAVLEALDEARPGDEGDNASTESDLATAGGAKSVSNAATWDIDVSTFNSHNRVQYYLDFFQTKGRERMGVWLTRMPRYEPMIRERLQEEGLPGDLVYLALIESGFSNSATSRSRAVGMWQFMKGTAKLYGLRVDSWVDERRDPYRATDAAARHLKSLNARFGSLYLACAAYNAGAGKVSRGLIRLPDDEADSVNSDATFFRLYDTKLLRRETKDYVPKLIAAALIAKEPTRYGFEVTRVDPPAYDSIVVPTMTGLDVIAKLADTTVAAIRELNPQYLRLATPPGVISIVRVPAGRGASTEAGYAVLPASRRVTFVEHVVARGETMGGIARRYHVSGRLLADANPKLKARRLRPGQLVVVPTGGALSSSVARRIADQAAPVDASPTGFHRVRWGETLSSIAKDFGVSQAALKRWNELGPEGRIASGQRLRVTPPKVRLERPRSPAPDSAALARTHLVRRGETLKGLARRYGVSVQALRDANGLSQRQPLKAGKSLRIPG